MLVDHMKTIGNLVDGLSETGTSLVDLSSAWNDYMNMIKPHLLEEEYYGHNQIKDFKQKALKNDNVVKNNVAS